MNCCDDFGNCNQGRNCPARTTNGGERIDTDTDIREEIACTVVILLAVLTPLFLVAIGVALGWLL